jgi:hypothetical protein
VDPQRESILEQLTHDDRGLVGRRYVVDRRRQIERFGIEPGGTSDDARRGQLISEAHEIARGEPPNRHLPGRVIEHDAPRGGLLGAGGRRSRLARHEQLQRAETDDEDQRDGERERDTAARRSCRRRREQARHAAQQRSAGRGQRQRRLGRAPGFELGERRRIGVGVARDGERDVVAAVLALGCGCATTPTTRQGDRRAASRRASAPRSRTRRAAGRARARARECARTCSGVSPASAATGSKITAAASRSPPGRPRTSASTTCTRRRSPSCAPAVRLTAATATAASSRGVIQAMHAPPAAGEPGRSRHTPASQSVTIVGSTSGAVAALRVVRHAPRAVRRMPMMSRSGAPRRLGRDAQEHGAAQRRHRFRIRRR